MGKWREDCPDCYDDDCGVFCNKQDPIRRRKPNRYSTKSPTETFDY